MTDRIDTAVGPAIDEDWGAPEVFADGVVVRIGAETVSVVFWREPVLGDGSRRRQCLTVIMPRAGYERLRETLAVRAAIRLM